MKDITTTVDICKVYDLRNINNKEMKPAILSQKVFNEIIQSLHNGGIIAFAANTVYGLGCDATNDKAIERLYKLKKRNDKKPIALFFYDKKQAENYAQFNDTANQLMSEFKDADLTIILKKKPNSNLSKNFNIKDDTVGFRIPNHPFSHKLLEKLGKPMAVTSANLAGYNTAESAEEIMKIFGNKINFIVDGNGNKSGIPSTIVDLSHNKIEVKRQGEFDIFAFADKLKKDKTNFAKNSNKDKLT